MVESFGDALWSGGGHKNKMRWQLHGKFEKLEIRVCEWWSYALWCMCMIYGMGMIGWCQSAKKVAD